MQQLSVHHSSDHQSSPESRNPAHAQRKHVRCVSLHASAVKYCACETLTKTEERQDVCIIILVVYYVDVICEVKINIAYTSDNRIHILKSDSEPYADFGNGSVF